MFEDSRPARTCRIAPRRAEFWPSAPASGDTSGARALTFQMPHCRVWLAKTDVECSTVVSKKKAREGGSLRSVLALPLFSVLLRLLKHSKLPMT